MAAYSFLNVVATISGPGGATPLASGAGAAEEGIKTSMKEEKNLATAGAGGEIMQTLRAHNLGRVTVTLLKTSAVNAVLSAMYNFQRTNPAGWGTNQITVTDTQRGDVVSATQMAFLKFPDVHWAKDANTIEWEFEGVVHEQLGTGAQNQSNVVGV